MSTDVAIEAAAKAVLYAALLSALGASAARWLLLPRVRRLVDAAVIDGLERSLRRVGLVAATVVVFALVLRAWTHTVAVSGLADSWRWESIRLVTIESRWGSSWQMQGIAACVWVLAHGAIRVGRKTGWLLATLAGIGFCFTWTLSGHAAGVPSRMLLHALHMLGAGVWLGTLSALLVSNVTAGRVGLLRSFAPVALSGAAVVALTGSTAAWSAEANVTVQRVVAHVGGRVDLPGAASGGREDTDDLLGAVTGHEALVRREVVQADDAGRRVRHDLGRAAAGQVERPKIGKAREGM